MPKISVIMPVYNTKKEFLREAIDSILNQTFQYCSFGVIPLLKENNLLNL